MRRHPFQEGRTFIALPFMKGLTTKRMRSSLAPKSRAVAEGRPLSAIVQAARKVTRRAIKDMPALLYDRLELGAPVGRLGAPSLTDDHRETHTLAPAGYALEREVCRRASPVIAGGAARS